MTNPQSISDCRDANSPPRGSTLVRGLRNLEELLSGTALAIVIGVIIVNVLIRFCFGDSLAWAEEIAAMGFAWTVFVGAAACYKRKLHLGIDLLTRLLPERWNRRLSLLTGVLLLLTHAYLTYLSTVFSCSAWNKPTAVLRIPYTFVDLSAAVGFALMTLHSLRYLAGWLHANPPAERPPA